MDDDSFENGNEISLHDGILLKKASAEYIGDINTTGSLSFVKYPENVHCIEWKPSDGFLISDTDTQEQGDWSFVDTIAKRNRTTSETLVFNTSTSTINVKEKENQNANSNKNRLVRAKVSDLKYIEIFNRGHGIRLMNKSDGKIHSEYFFQHGNADGFVRILQTNQWLQRTRTNKNLYEFVEHLVQDGEKLQKTFAELKIDDIKGSSGWISNMVRKPYEQTMDIFSKIADVYTLVPSNNASFPQSQDNLKENSPTGLTEYDMFASTFRLPVTEDVNGSKEEAEKELPVRPKVQRGSPLNEKQWQEFVTEDGRISDPDRVKEIIFRGGMEHNLRAEVWKYLLNYDQWHLSKEERTLNRRKKTQEYFQMKLQWWSLSETQENNFSDYRDRKCQVEKDVKRTDRSLEFFAGDENPNLEILHEILMTYIMYNFDLGYVQGMSDLLAPILYVMQNVADAFWCFVGFMNIVFSNFDMDQAGMKQQLKNLTLLLAFSNPRLYSYFQEHASENMYFCFRWLLVWFKREFSNIDIMELWEVLWTGLPCTNFHLFVCVAILDEQMNIFIDNQYEFTEILKHVNELSCKIDLKSTLEKAEAIYLQIKEAPTLTDEIRLIIGMEPLVKEKCSDDEDEEKFDEIKREKTREEEEYHQRKLEEALEQSMFYSFL